MNDTIESILFVGSGIAVTLKLLVGGLSVGLVLGICFAVLRHQNICAKPINAIISVLRGTPLLLQLSLIYFSVPSLIGIKLTMVAAGILTFGFNSGAYIAEIMRSGIESLPKGQFEAAQTLHISKFYMWRDIILPQIFKNTLPAMMNETIALLKETALIATIGGMDLMRSAQILAAEKFTYFMPLCIAGAYYYGLVLVIEYTGRILEQRSGYAKH